MATIRPETWYRWIYWKSSISVKSLAAFRISAKRRRCLASIRPPYTANARNSVWIKQNRLCRARLAFASTRLKKYASYAGWNDLLQYLRAEAAGKRTCSRAERQVRALRLAIEAKPFEQPDL